MDYTGGSPKANHLCVLVHGVRSLINHVTMDDAC